MSHVKRWSIDLYRSVGIIPLEYNMFGTPSISILTDVISGLTNFSESLVPATEGAVNKNSKPVMDRRGTLTCSLITLSFGLENVKVLWRNRFS